MCCESNDKSINVLPPEEKEVSNFVNDRYLVSSVNFIICIDQSFLDKKRNISFFLAQDLASRVIVGHFFKRTPINVEDLVVFFDRLVEVRGRLKPIEVIHSDRESLFKNSVFKSFLDKHNIKHSRGSTLGHNNQTVERLNRTLKSKMKTLLLNTPGVGVTKSNFSFSKISASLLESTLLTAVENYNNSAHPFNYNMSPNNFDFSLVSKEAVSPPALPVVLKEENTLFLPPVIKEKEVLLKEKESTPMARLAKDTNCSDAVEIRKIRKTVAVNFANDWERFFLDWRSDQTWQNKQLVLQNKLLLEQNFELQGSVTELRTSMEFLTSEAELQKQLRLKKERAKEKRRLALKQPLRDVLSGADFEYVLSLCSGPHYTSQRKTLALAILYMTGLRVSNLLVLTVKNVSSLLKEGSMQIPLIKRGAPRHNIDLSEEGRVLFFRFKKEFKTLSRTKRGSDFLFTAKNNNAKALSRETFDKELNVVLKKSSEVLGKHLRTHSLRATMITDLLISTPLHKVKDVIGHSDIKSTHTYARGALTREEVNKVISTLIKDRGSKLQKV